MCREEDKLIDLGKTEEMRLLRRLAVISSSSEERRGQIYRCLECRSNRIWREIGGRD